jgi:hypothetical protein
VSALQPNWRCAPTSLKDTTLGEICYAVHAKSPNLLAQSPSELFSVMNSLIPESIDVNGLIQKVDSASAKYGLPALITTSPNNPQDYEAQQVQKQFQRRVREQLTGYDVSMMIVDHILINDQAILHFLPRLIRGILMENVGNVYLLQSRLKLIDQTKTDSETNSVIDLLIQALEQVIDHQSQFE